jgi:hypothetical protein
MTQRELERELSRTTGESLGTIRQRGFGLVEVRDPTPRYVDWEEQSANHIALLPNRSASRRVT